VISLAVLMASLSPKVALGEPMKTVFGLVGSGHNGMFAVAGLMLR
jgi:hypothetical protein